MAKEYNVGDRLYLPVWVTEKETNVMMGPDKSTVITDANFAYTYMLGQTKTGKVRYGEEGLLLTAEEVADNIDLITRATLEEYREGAVRRIQELEVECEKWKATAQNCENSAKAADNAADNLRLENKKLKAENGNLKANAAENADTISRLSANKIALTEEVGRLRETIADRTKDVQHITEESTELKVDYDVFKARNAELEALLKEVMATRDEAVRQINELLAENSKLKSDCNDWKKTANERLSAMQMLSTDRNKLIGSNAELKEWYDEANKTASEAAEANDELKAKIADLRNRVGEQLAQIQDLNAEVHFHKEFGEGLDKQQKKLQARYDELLSINKEQSERIRTLNEKVADLETKNSNLSFLLEADSEKEPTKTIHVVLNDGTEIRFKRCTSYDYRTDIDMLVVKDGDNYIAGFMRGDKPGNLAYWMGE